MQCYCAEILCILVHIGSWYLNITWFLSFSDITQIYCICKYNFDLYKLIKHLSLKLLLTVIMLSLSILFCSSLVINSSSYSTSRSVYQKNWMNLYSSSISWVLALHRCYKANLTQCTHSMSNSFAASLPVFIMFFFSSSHLGCLLQHSALF